MDKRDATAFVEQLDIDGLPHCALCLFDVAWELSQRRRVHPSTVTRTVDWVWMESGDAARRVVVKARMQEVPGAEEALKSIDEHGFRSPVARAIVVKLAEAMAEEIAERQPP